MKGPVREVAAFLVGLFVIALSVYATQALGGWLYTLQGMQVSAFFPKLLLGVLTIGFGFVGLAAAIIASYTVGHFVLGCVEDLRNGK